MVGDVGLRSQMGRGREVDKVVGLGHLNITGLDFHRGADAGPTESVWRWGSVGTCSWRCQLQLAVTQATGFRSPNKRTLDKL